MKEVIVHKGPRVQIIDSEIPKPGPGQVVTKVVVSGCNPKDWKRPTFMPDAPPSTKATTSQESSTPSAPTSRNSDRETAWRLSTR
ncbi:hypothetical protein LTR94_010109 [Friedmanniomyces endolithicus]|nr:hypothetical protein LTR94_010109 [Friedmanniomyces endolithicus]